MAINAKHRCDAKFVAEAFTQFTLFTLNIGPIFIYKLFNTPPICFDAAPSSSATLNLIESQKIPETLYLPRRDSRIFPGFIDQAK